MLLAELNIRHTRRHMPTRRVAVDHGYLPTSGPAFGGVLLGAVIAEHVPGLDEDQLDALGRFVDGARRGLTVPRIALRYRLQTDTHGLDLLASPHHQRRRRARLGAADPRARPPRPVGTAGDRRDHGRGAAPAVGTQRRLPVRRRRRRPPRGAPRGARRPAAATRACPGVRPPPPGTTTKIGPAAATTASEWAGIPSERRWAMEVLGLHAGLTIERDDVQRRFRRLVRLAHPDHGAGSSGAAERIAELTEAPRAAARRHRFGRNGACRVGFAHGREPPPRHRHRRRGPDRLRARPSHRQRAAARPRPAGRAAAARDRARAARARGRGDGAGRRRPPAARRHRGDRRPEDRVRRRLVGAARRLDPAQGGHGARRPPLGQRRDLQAPGPGHQRPRGRATCACSWSATRATRTASSPARTRPTCPPTAGSR